MIGDKCHGDSKVSPLEGTKVTLHRKGKKSQRRKETQDSFNGERRNVVSIKD